MRNIIRIKAKHNHMSKTTPAALGKVNIDKIKDSFAMSTAGPMSPRMQAKASSTGKHVRLDRSNTDFLSGNMSVPNDELASQNLISDPEEIEDSQASDFSRIKRNNALKRKWLVPKEVIFEGGSPNNAGATS